MFGLMRSAAASLGAAAGASLKGRAQGYGYLAFAAVFFAVAGVFLLLALFFGLMTVFEPWLAALITAAISAALGGIVLLMASGAKRRAREETRIRMLQAEQEALTQVSLLGQSFGRAGRSNGVKGLGLAALAGYLLTRR